MKVIVAHPGRQHSFQTASSLKNNNMLFKYITTVYDKNNSLIMSFLKLFLSADNTKRANGRKCGNLDDNDVIQFCKIGGLIEIFLARFDKTRKIYNFWHDLNTDRFGKKVAEYAIKNNVDAVIMYDTNALACFKILKKKAPSISRIMDVSAANRLYMKCIYENDFKICPQFSGKLRQERSFLWKEKSCKRLKEELENTEFFLAPSSFVKNSLIFSNIKEEDIFICPYGSNFTVSETKKTVKQEEPLEAVYVGNVTEMKGIYYLLEAAKRINTKKIKLTVIGAYDNSDGLFDRYKDYVSFTGRVTHDKVKEILLSSDFFVFPSLGEGLSLSVLEALACRLPCIVTKNSGANDAIEDYKNGFVIDIQDIDSIVEKMNWFNEHRFDIPDMGDYAVKSVEKYNWSDYEKCLAESIKEILKKTSA